MIKDGIDTLNDAKNIELFNRVIKVLIKKGVISKTDLDAEAETRNLVI